MSSTVVPGDDRGVEVTMLPVSAGDATLIVWSDGGTTHSVLIDAGLREREAVSYLQSIGVFHLDLVILSHPDLDHLGGLLAIVNSRAMSVDRIWCFDLDFLRRFVKTGRIPDPRPATREVMYRYALLSTLDRFSEILKTANGRGVQVLQVSEGYRFSLGGVLFEVLYPPQSFYDALHNPVALKRMLNRRWPDEWTEDGGDSEERETSKARLLPGYEQQERLTEVVDKPQMPEDGVLLSDLEDELGGPEQDAEGSAPDSEGLPWRMVGTLYNNMSIVVKATILGGINSPSILLPGDLSDWTTLVMRQWPNLKSDVLKAPHHGSKRIRCDFRPARLAFRQWMYLYEVFYPGPWPWPLQTPWSRRKWRRFHETVYGDDPARLLQELVAPRHVLVFPHPQHKLPSMAPGGLQSNVIANRMDRDPSVLCDKSNVPFPSRLLIGLEQSSITDVKA